MDSAVGFSREDTVITLGDYVDRGPDSKGVIDFLIGLRERCNLVTLRGNHEIMMEQARENRGNAAGWLSVGGHETMDSYHAATLEDVPARHWEFLRNCLPSYETKTHFFVHANAYPDIAIKDQPDSMLYWEFFDNPPPHESGRTMVCGHSSQKSGLPLNVGHAVCIDTWAYGGGWLTCLDVESGGYWQTNERGESRCDHL